MDNETTIEASAERDGEVTLSTGVVIRGRRVPDEIMLRAFKRSRDTAPKVPIWRNPDKGRDEPNPNDPDYLRAKELHAANVGLYMMNALIMYGVEVVSIPSGMVSPDSQEWAAEIELSGIGSGPAQVARLLDWLTIKAGPLPDDRKAMLQAAGRATGTLEVDVAEAVKRL